MKTKVFQHSTIGGETGQMKDRIAEKTVIEVKTSLDMMHTSGIPVKEEAVKNGLQFHFFLPTVSRVCQLIFTYDSVLEDLKY